MKEADLILDVKYFDLKYTLECGQCFRWEKVADYEYIGVIVDRVLRLKQQGNILKVWSNESKDLEKVVKHYLDLNEDYEKIEKEIASIDDNIQRSLKYTSGIHILNQQPFETIISYIISANNNIKRISRSVNDISKKYGQVVEFENKTYYLFPTIDELQKATTEELLSCGVGFRARYIKHDVERLKKEANYIENLKEMTVNEAYEKLSSLMGVGPKVADCIILFSLQKKEVFPVDVWVKRIMEKLYFKDNTSLKVIRKYADDNFGKYAGIVQQHLFHNVREGNI